MKFIKILKANEVPNRVLELLQESYQENCKPLAYLSTRGGKTEIVISKDKFGINITTYIDGKSQSSDNSISDLDSHWTKYYSNDINKEFGQPLYKLIWSDPSLDTSIFTKMKKESAIQQPNKPKPTTMLPDNMEWSWNPDAADWVAVMKDNTNVTPPLYAPNNQNVINTNATSYMSNIKSASVTEEELYNQLTEEEIKQFNKTRRELLKNEFEFYKQHSFEGRRDNGELGQKLKEVVKKIKDTDIEIMRNIIENRKISASCLEEFLDGPRYSKEIKIEAGLIKEGLLKYAGFDFNRGTKYVITDKGLDALRKASEVEHNEAQNEREKLAYLFEFDTDKVDTLDTTGKVIKSDDIYSKFINDFRIQDYLKKCVKDGMLEGNKEVGSTLIDEDKYIGMFTSELKPVDFANFDTEKAKELLKQELAKIEKESGFFDKNAKYIKIESKKFTIHENNGDIIGEIEADNESDAKIKFGIEHPEYAESLSICAKEIDAKYEETTESHEPYPNPSETPNEQITLENHDGWVNTADQKVTPEFAQLHTILGEYKKAGHILNIFQEGNDLLVTASPIGSFEMKQQLEQLGYECEETDQSDTGDAYSMPTYTLRIKLK